MCSISPVQHAESPQSTHKHEHPEPIAGGIRVQTFCRYQCKLFKQMVGTIGFEPTTSTVSRANGAARRGSWTRWRSIKALGSRSWTTEPRVWNAGTCSAPAGFQYWQIRLAHFVPTDEIMLSATSRFGWPPSLRTCHPRNPRSTIITVTSTSSAPTTLSVVGLFRS